MEESTQIEGVENKYELGAELTESPTEAPPKRKGNLKIKCGCGAVTLVTEDVVTDGLSMTMLVGSEHYITLSCPECKANITMFIDEIIDKDELQEESNKE